MPDDQNENRATADAWAARIGAVLVAGFALVAAFTFVDRKHRATLEQVQEPTAVGDTHFVQAAEAGTKIGRFAGKTLIVEKSAKGRDSKMRRVGSDEAGALTLYRPADSHEDDAFFLKVAEGDYLKVRAR